MAMATISTGKTAAGVAFVAALLLALALNAQTGKPTLDGVYTILDGVYTVQQAERARAVYADQCSECHGRDLAAYENHILTTNEFTSDWEGLPLIDLFDKIYINMSAKPPGRLRMSKPRQITRQETADLVAMILWFNGFPEGKTELSPKPEELRQIRFESHRP